MQNCSVKTVRVKMQMDRIIQCSKVLFAVVFKMKVSDYCYSSADDGGQISIFGFVLTILMI